MGRIPQQAIEEVLGRTNILEIIQQYVALKRAGINYKGLCPFHQEKSPSFHVHPAKGIYKCFGCGAGGDVINFLMELEGWTFQESVRSLAGRLGLELEEESEEDQRAAKQRQEARRQYQQIMSLARGYYEDQLWGVDGQRARGYLKDRGVDEATARKFGLGYAPPGWQNLLDTLNSKGINGPLAQGAGLALERNQGEGHYDRFRDRLLFPVIDIWGHTLAFSGRVLPGDDGPKYINSSETAFYVKGEQLYGLHVAKRGIQQREFALLVEGNFDVVTLHAAGLDMVVAPMGTAFTTRQAQLLRRYTTKVILAFDGDSAGEEATLKALAPLEEAQLEARVIRFEKGDDPDSFVRREGANALLSKVDIAQPLIEWALDRVLPKGGDMEVPIEDRLHALEAASQIIKEIKNPILLAHYKRELERRLAIDPSLYASYLPKAPAPSPKPAPAQEAAPRDSQPPWHDDAPPRGSESRAPASQPAQAKASLARREFVLLVLLMEHPEWLVYFCQEELQNLLMSQELAEFLLIAAATYQEQGQLHPALLLSRCPYEHFKAVLTEAFASIGEFYEEEKAIAMYQDTLRTIKRHWADQSIAQLEQERQRLDFFKEREQYIQLQEQIKQLQQFKLMQIEGPK